MPHEHRLHARCGCATSHATAALELEHGGGHGRPFAFPQASRKFERDRPFRVDHLAVELTLDLALKSVHGSATLSLSRIDPEAEMLVLDAIAFDVKGVQVGKAGAPYVYDGRQLHVTSTILRHFSVPSLG